jgi:hypothetical protein
MSYDLYLIKADIDAVTVVEALLRDSEGDDPNPGELDPSAEARKQHLVQALQASNPALKPFEFDHSEIARIEGISEAEARRSWRHVELNGPEDGNGIQITLHDETATVTVPYWHQGEAAAAVWEEIWTYLGVLQSSGGFRTYDPQLKRILELKRDREAVMQTYARGVTFTEQVVGKAQPGKKPWWKFW